MYTEANGAGMITSCGDRASEDLYHGRHSARTRRFPAEIMDSALRKLDMLNSVASLTDLRALPGNRLEALRGDRVGFHSVRVDVQWRLVFRWENNNAHDVELTDYH